MVKIIQQGAEAKIILSNNFITKDRVKKSYRLKELDDMIRKRRTKAETKLLEKASKIINAPIPLKSEKQNQIVMPFIEGKKLSEHLDSLKNRLEVCKKIGESIAKLHDESIIHGDLTTSNMILVDNLDKKANNISNQPKNLTLNKKNQRSALTKSGAEQHQLASDSEQVFFIDFGLGFISRKIEDKAVDLHLLKQALEAKHFRHWQELWKAVEQGYSISKNSKAVLNQLKKVESRGRYKEKY
ncbi:MAG: RIO1 family regulatory kinase/ATPase [Nanoarchaeota archaeon]